jgi:hypothetical protein
MVGHSAGELFLGHGQRRPGRDTDTTHYDVGWILPGSQRALLPTGLSPEPPRQMVAAPTTCQSVVQGYIDIFCKLCIQLHIGDPEEVLVIKFNSGLLMHLRHEVDLFESSSLDKAFLRALAIERKVAPRIRSPQPGYDPSTTGPSQVTPTATSTPRTMPWCTFHKTNSHASTDCRALQNLHPNKTLFAEVTQSDSPDPPEVVSLENPTEVDPSLILMTTNEHDTSFVPLFTHNCQIKHELATLILDNGSQKNLITQDLVQCLQLPTTPHPEPYHLGWVQKEGPRLTVSRCCAVTFAIGPFEILWCVMFLL